MIIEYITQVARFILIAVLSLFLAGSSAAQDRAHPAPFPPDRSFKKFSAGGFEIFSDAPIEVVRRVQELAAGTQRSVIDWANRLGLNSRLPAEAMRLLIFRDQTAFERHIREIGLTADPGVPGYFDERRNYCAILDISGLDAIRRKKDELFIARKELSILRGQKGADDACHKRLAALRDLERQIASFERLINSTVVRHEIAHMVLFNLGLQRIEDKHRRWLKEGLAMQFEGDDPLNAFRWHDFEAIPPAERTTVLRDLISNPAEIGPGAERAARSYAMAWAIVHYLSGAKTAQFKEYLTRPSGTPQDHLHDFEEHFGPVDEKMIDDLVRFTERRAS